MCGLGQKNRKSICIKLITQQENRGLPLLREPQGVKEVDTLAERAKKSKIKELAKPVIEAYMEYVD